MAEPIRQNESDANARQVEIYLEDTAGNGYTGSTSGFTILYRKPQSGADTTKTLTAQGGDGRFVMQLSAGDADTAGPGWVKVYDGVGAAIIPYVDGVEILAEDPGVTSLQSSMSTALTNLGTLITNLAAVAAQATDIQGRLPNALVSGNLKTIVEAYAAGQAPLQPAVAGRTLGVTAAGRAGIDWANVENPGTSVNLSSTTVGLVSALAGAAYTAIAGAVIGATIDGSYTVKGALARLNAFMLGKATGLLSSVAAFYLADGSTKAMQYTQDTSAGTRVAAGTVNGD